MLRSFFDNVFRMGVTIIVICGGFTACRDNSSPDSSTIRNRATPPAAVRKASDTKTEMAWVGEAHNRALDDLRAEMRKPGLLTNNFCEYVADFSARPDRLPNDKVRGQAKDRLAIAKRVQKERKLCKADPVTAVTRQDDGTYNNISALSAQIESEIDLASDRYDLANRLVPIWRSAGSLNETEAAIVAATLVTAQSSFEYWEVEVDRAYQEFQAEYSDCARTASSDGYDYDQARQFCLEGALLPTRGPRYAPNPARIAGFAPARDCRLGPHFKALAKADAIGAFTGAIKGVLGGAVGIGASALTGGIVGSAASWASSTWELYKCALK